MDRPETTAPSSEWPARLRRGLWLWTPAVVQMAVIFRVSSIPDLEELPGGVPDWVGHGIGYAILGVLLLRALAGAQWVGVTTGAAVAAVGAAAAYGVVDELHQRLVPGRSAEIHDLLADIGGASLAVGLLVTWGILSRARAGPGSNRC